MPDVEGLCAEVVFFEILEVSAMTTNGQVEREVVNMKL